MLTGIADLGTKLGALCEEKNHAYGDSFAQTGDFLRLIYPNGIAPEQYGDALCIVRIFDKLARIATDKDAFGESPYNDIVGYGLLGSIMSQKRIEQGLIDKQNECDVATRGFSEKSPIGICRQGFDYIPTVSWPCGRECCLEIFPQCHCKA